MPGCTIPVPFCWLRSLFFLVTEFNAVGIWWALHFVAKKGTGVFYIHVCAVTCHYNNA